MPSKNEKQEKTMKAAAHSPQFAKKVGIPQGVAKDYEAADKAKRVKTKAKKPKRRSGK